MLNATENTKNQERVLRRSRRYSRRLGRTRVFRTESFSMLVA